ncbi:MAG: iron-sulfur cluster assembly accessory protein [Alphaproteobacteria bacterium TMED194]|nr:MAG: iron-sulfur cluster assembly accessory protein [Alphaproteobacteria bacterium TMED194]
MFVEKIFFNIVIINLWYYILNMNKTSNKNEKNILVSKSAINQFKKILFNEDKNSFVRLLVDSGGCSGFSYKFSVDKSIDDSNDIIILEEENKNIFVTDKISFDYLKNSSVDWIESLTNSQFTISNPIAKSSCGCGSSFSI